MADLYVPPPKEVLDVLLDEAVRSGLGIGEEFGEDVMGGIAVRLTTTFPDIPAATLGRVTVALSMGAGSFLVALQELGARRVPGAVICDLLSATGARMTQDGAAGHG